MAFNSGQWVSLTCGAANLGRSRLFRRPEPAESRLRAELPAPRYPEKLRERLAPVRALNFADGMIAMQLPTEPHKLILIVEDEGIIAADIQNRLERLGYKAVSYTHLPATAAICSAGMDCGAARRPRIR